MVSDGSSYTPTGHRAPRRAWLILATFAALWGIANAVGVIALLVNARVVESILGMLSVLAAYWFAIGAWRRTPWGLGSLENAPPDPPTLSHRRAVIYRALAAGCVVAAGTALALQAFVFADQ